MSSREALLTECHDLALRLAPELAAQPLYVVDADELEGLPQPGSCLGWTRNEFFFDLAHRDRLGDRYLGPGNFVCLELKAIEEAALPGMFESCVRSVMIHEVGHIVPFREVLELPDLPEVREVQLRRSKKAHALPELEPGEPHDSHDLRFSRRTLHLYFRAWTAGESVVIDRLFGGERICFHADRYMPILENEALEMRNASFSKIDAFPIPPELQKLWDEDCREHANLFKRPKTKVKQ